MSFRKMFSYLQENVGQSMLALGESRLRVRLCRVGDEWEWRTRKEVSPLMVMF